MEKTNVAFRPRRADRAIADEGWIRGFLERADFGTLATTAGDQPCLHANLFVLDPDRRAIYLHMALEGQTLDNLRANPRVSFSAAEMGRLLPADTAMEFSVEYASVVAFGTAALVTDDAEARRGLELLLDKYFPRLERGIHYRDIQPDELARTAVVRVDVEAWSGKAKVTASAL